MDRAPGMPSCAMLADLQPVEIADRRASREWQFGRVRSCAVARLNGSSTGSGSLYPGTALSGVIAAVGAEREDAVEAGLLRPIGVVQAQIVDPRDGVVAHPP